MDNSTVSSLNLGQVVGGNITTTVDQLTLTDAGTITSGSFGGTNAGAINVEASHDIEISGTGSQISANTETNGSGGVVTVTAGGNIDLNGGDIFAATDSSGHGGTVNVEASSMTFEGASRVSTSTHGSGKAGSINLSLGGSLTMGDTSAILADTETTAAGGNIMVDAAQINMSGQSLISANTLFGSGSGGGINITTGLLSIQGTGVEPLGSLGITSDTLAQGNAGTVTVTAGKLSLGGGGVHLRFL